MNIRATDATHRSGPEGPLSEARRCVSAVCRQSSTRSAHGFTLVELLVSIAILLLLFGAVVTMFVASIRAVKAGYQVAEAMETQRGAFHIMEQDLSAVFTSRDYGDFYQFHGGAYGMTMVGLVRAADQYVTLGRITYVLHRNVRPEAVEVGENAAGDSVYAPTMSLLRYVEPGVTSLDSYSFYDDEGNPKTWNDLISDPELGSTLETVLRDGCDCDPSATDLDSARIELLKAKKRDLWIGMLSGRDPNMPNVWITDAQIKFAQANGLAVPEPELYLRIDRDGDPVTLVADDYVVAENIRSELPIPGVPAAGSPAVNWSFLDADTHPYFVYGQVRPNTVVDLRDGDDIDEASPTAAGPWWRTTWNSALNLAHWNGVDDVQTFEEDALSNLLDGVTTPVFNGAGSLLTPRLPEAVQVKFTFVYPAPYLTAVPYERNYEQIIDIPTAFTRTTLTEVP